MIFGSLVLLKKKEEERRFTPKGGNKGIHFLLISLKVGLDNNYKVRLEVSQLLLPNWDGRGEEGWGWGWVV